ncbi:hypothetical protein A3E39_04370 [Candidatus Uhrbacteria bacterium RIFCSPHIGHO2_12_FULL_60_25]|uniref:SPOR domain-containing protein n=1 Tax=Candidatus Uhrbacteria bacterium RIFCSPHIGHO2_12_FULL_60_25 TaxID=1802399 RepID=A0A1F7UIP3_9BACT|nr:MAG: hypothetical protein A3D73_00920 [Candidatus Uhrbacteria bacterium RIFCSPHIGHO2_02_FULL_60_44]OGL78122.1 MAG: hypothetical protein A3E39_04370 [Candidatus Uhrbacteria bacterium RIFCSPHIGHO2_12_FULL_60_25]
MNKSTFTHKLSLIFVVFATFAIAGCGTAAINAHPVARVAVVTTPVEIVSHGTHADVASKNALEQARVADADETRIVAVASNDSRSARDVTATPSFSARNQGACAWVLMGTGESFTSKSEALEHAKERKLADRRVVETCDFFRLESRPTVSMR